LEIPSHGPIDYGNKKCSKEYNFLQQEESEEMHLIHNKRHDVDAGTDYKQNLESRAGAVLLVVVVSLLSRFVSSSPSNPNFPEQKCRFQVPKSR
jgi:hypothetical protein